MIRQLILALILGVCAWCVAMWHQDFIMALLAAKLVKHFSREQFKVKLREENVQSWY